MDDQELMRKLEELKTQVELRSRERDELKQMLHNMIGFRTPLIRPPTAAEIIREDTIDIWKDIERRERRYRVEAIGLETRRKVFDEEVYFWETR